MMRTCPGSIGIRTPVISEKICPECGREIELFSIDPYMRCECGFIAYNDTQNCLQWCAHAEQCVGTKIYRRFMEGKELKKGGTL